MKKTALITGASSGIGAATARALAELGYNLVITGRRTNRLKSLNDELEEKYHVKVHVLGFDIQDRFQTQSALDGLPETFRHLDLLINNAGLAAGLEHIDEGDWRDWESMIDTNIKGLLCVSRIVSQWMIDQHIKGHIINMGSIAGTQAYENGAVYCATKHAVHALSQGMRMDLLKHGIKVTEIRPGMVETEFSIVRFHGDKDRADKVYEGIEPLTGEDIARIIAWIVTLPEHVNINDIEVMPARQANAFLTYRD
ncbi:MAG TPA: SDR family NAD(P)-dependent oxidoreductase [Candidatus Alistipes merdigallinarum]|nr:SDR family NAD(P)-dependent oxidoreductase [Candidatus Alistipes merdigallinarum]